MNSKLENILRQVYAQNRNPKRLLFVCFGQSVLSGANVVLTDLVDTSNIGVEIHREVFYSKSDWNAINAWINKVPQIA